MAKAKTTGTEDTAPETTVENTVAQEVPLNPDTQVVPDATPAGHGSRDFHSPV